MSFAAGKAATLRQHSARCRMATHRTQPKPSAETLTSSLAIVRRVQEALEAAGVVFLNQGRPSVQLKAKA